MAQFTRKYFDFSEGLMYTLNIVYLLMRKNRAI